MSVFWIFSFDVGRPKRDPNTSTRSFDKPPYKKNRPPFESKKRGSFRDKSTYAQRSSEPRRSFSWGHQIPWTTPEPVAGYPYQYWSQYLIRTFDSRMYNDFRRFALDDLFTRHNQYGFDALMGYFSAALFSPEPLPDEVIMDIAQMSSGVPFDPLAAVLQLLQFAMGSGMMEQQNRLRAGIEFNRAHDQPQKGNRVPRRHSCY